MLVDNKTHIKSFYQENRVSYVESQRKENHLQQTCAANPAILLYLLIWDLLIGTTKNSSIFFSKSPNKQANKWVFESLAK